MERRSDNGRLKLIRNLLEREATGARPRTPTETTTTNIANAIRANTPAVAALTGCVKGLYGFVRNKRCGW